MSLRPIAWFVFLIVAVRGTQAPAATISVNPSADAFVSSANSVNNYGGAGAVHVSAATAPQGAFQALFRFDLAAARADFDAAFGAGNWSIDSAALQLTASAPNSALFNPSAPGDIAVTWMQNDAWTEGAGTPMAPGATGVTWASLPTFLSASDQSLGTINFSGATSGTAAYPLTHSSGFNSDTATGGLVSLLLSASDGNSTASGLFNSRSFGNVASRPLLTLSAVAIPEPGAYGLAMLAIVVALVLRAGGRFRSHNR